MISLLFAATLLVHHSLTNYDTSQPFRVKGTIVQLQQMNPHSILFLEERTADGSVRRWAVEGPAVLQLQRRSFPTDTLKTGTAVEVCGYLPKEPIVWQVASENPGKVSLSGRLLNGELITMADGKQQSWGDYGVHRCFGPQYRDQHTN